jgi:hypothetical protein
MEVIVVDSQVWNELNLRLSSMEQILISLQNEKKSLPSHYLEWIPLKQVYQLLDINKQKWVRHYKTLFKTRKYGRETWVYKPSLEKWLMSNAIN